MGCVRVSAQLRAGAHESVVARAAVYGDIRRAAPAALRAWRLPAHLDGRVHSVPCVSSSNALCDWFQSLDECLHWNHREQRRPMQHLPSNINLVQLAGAASDSESDLPPPLASQRTGSSAAAFRSESSDWRACRRLATCVPFPASPSPT